MPDQLLLFYRANLTYRITEVSIREKMWIWLHFKTLKCSPERLHALDGFTHMVKMVETEKTGELGQAGQAGE